VTGSGSPFLGYPSLSPTSDGLEIEPILIAVGEETPTISDTELLSDAGSSMG